MKLHDLKPAPGSKRAQAPRRARHRRQGRQDRRPWQQGPGRPQHRVAPASRVARRRSHRRTPKAKGFKNPFRVEYHVVNLDTLEAFDAGAEVDPDTLRAQGLVAKRGLVKVLGRGELTKSLTVRAHAFSEAARRGDRGRGRPRRGAPGPLGRPAARRPEGTPSPTGRLHSPSASSGGRHPPMSRALAPAEHVPGPRPPEQDPLHDLHHLRLPGRRRTSRSRTSTSSAIKQLQNQTEATAAWSASSTCSRAARSPSVAIFFLGIMPYITASIIMQLLGVVIPKLEEWQNEGQTGQKKITQWTRYLTVALALMQSTGVRVRAEERQRRAARPVERQLPAGHRCSSLTSRAFEPRSSCSPGPPAPRW